jgi:hypothetical protein
VQAELGQREREAGWAGKKKEREKKRGFRGGFWTL